MDAPNTSRGAAEATTRRRDRGPIAVVLIAGLLVLILGALILTDTHPRIIGMGQVAPPAGEIWLGSSLDPSQLGLPARDASIASGHQVAYIAHLARASRGETLALDINDAGSAAMLSGGDLAAGDDVLGGVIPAAEVSQAGTLTVRVVDQTGNTLATGSATLTP